MLQTSCKMCSYACQGCLFFAASLILRLFMVPTTNPCLFSRFAFLLLFVSLNKKNRPSASEQDLRERDNDRPTIEKPRLQIRASRQSEAIRRGISLLRHRRRVLMADWRIQLILVPLRAELRHSRPSLAKACLSDFSAWNPFFSLLPLHP